MNCWTLRALTLSLVSLSAMSIPACGGSTSEDVLADEAEGLQLGSFVCNQFTVEKRNAPQAHAKVKTARAAYHTGYDRFVLEFDGTDVPNYSVTRQRHPTFLIDGEGAPVT